MKTSKMSLIHCTSKNSFFETRAKSEKIDPKDKVIDDLGIDFEV